MKVLFSALVCSSLFELSIAREQATYNIENTDERDSLNSLGNDQPVNIIFKKTAGISNIMYPMSMNINVEVGRTGITGASLLKKDLEHLERSNIEYEIDYPQYVLGDSVSHLRKLSEETPYGINMVLEDMDFWKGLDKPSGSIKVCVADTGYDLGHVDLPSGGDVTGTDSASNGSWDNDGHGHGTHCSGTVAGIGDNNEGVVGVIPDNAGGNFQLVIGKALSNSGSGSLSGVLAAVQSCVDDGAKVISLSLGGGGYSSTTNDFYNNLYENEDILFVAAAGNGGSSSNHYPASYPALMSVAAIDSNENKASFSQYNDQVEISAPGVSVKSSLPKNKYASWSGTSMATPHVAGVAGLLWMYFPECKNYQIRNVIAATAKDLGDGACNVQYGHGLVQAKKAYELLSEGNCGGQIGESTPVGGCDQLFGEPECESDAECDDGDTCTEDSCVNGQCVITAKCESCGKSKVQVDITIDNYGGETSYNIKDSNDATMMQGSGWPANSQNSFFKCFPSGSYKFTITDSYGDGICCSYGNGGYSVKVNDAEVATGGNFGSEEQKTFDVPAPPTPSPISQTPEPSSTGSTIKTFAPTTTGSAVETFAPTTTGSVAETFAPTTTGSVAETFAPTTTGSTINNPPSTMHPTHTPPTMHPTHTPPTMYPTHTPPTPFPTETPPTPFPTETPPTSFPTVGSCKLKGEPCAKASDCCKNKCNTKKNICRK